MYKRIRKPPAASELVKQQQRSALSSPPATLADFDLRIGSSDIIEKTDGTSLTSLAVFKSEFVQEEVLVEASAAVISWCVRLSSLWDDFETLNAQSQSASTAALPRQAKGQARRPRSRKELVRARRGLRSAEYLLPSHSKRGRAEVGGADEVRSLYCHLLGLH